MAGEYIVGQFVRVADGGTCVIRPAMETCASGDKRHPSRVVRTARHLLPYVLRHRHDVTVASGTARMDALPRVSRELCSSACLFRC